MPHSSSAIPFEFDEVVETASRSVVEDAPTDDAIDDDALRAKFYEEFQESELAKQTALLQSIQIALNGVQDQRDDMLAAHIAQLVSGAKEIVKRLFSNATVHHHADFAEELLDTFAQKAVKPTRATLYVSRSIDETLLDRLRNAASKAPNDHEITIETHKDIDRYDCRMEWRDGSMTRNLREILAQIEIAFDAHKTIDAPLSRKNTP
ncbi:MAG: hypothetical protein AAGB02_02520 [Pseudomonadota bacterium]